MTVLQHKIVVVSPLWPMSCLAMSSHLINGTRYRYHLVEWDLNPVRMYFVALMTFVPPLYWWECLARKVMIVAVRAHS